MAIRWDWNEKCGEATLVQAFDNIEIEIYKED